MDTLLTTLLTPTAIIGMIMALAEIAKNVGVPHRFIPVVDIILGVLLSGLINGLYRSMHPVECLVIGLVLGLSACGLFSGAKNVFNLEKED